MKADARAPATTRPKIASGILKAARYASRSGVSPKCAPITDSRSQPSTRLATRVTIMIAEARAIDIGNTLILRHRVSFALNAGKEAQALSPQAHPPDAAAHLHANDRPLRRADRRAAARGRGAAQAGFADSVTAPVCSGSYAEGGTPPAHWASEKSAREPQNPMCARTAATVHPAGIRRLRSESLMRPISRRSRA